MEKNNSLKSYMAAAYLRLSKEDENLSDKSESNSITNQRALILKELESIPEVTIFDFYVDDGYTGLNFERPEFRHMLDDILDGKVNMVVVKDLSRLGRDYIEAGRYVKKIFPSLNVRFMSILDRYDSCTASQSDTNLLVPVKNFINDNYSRDISTKVRSHQEVMRENGLYIGSYVAYGYKKMEGDKNRIVPDGPAATIVKRIFAWKLQGLNAESIADKLNSLGIASPSEYKRQEGINYRSGFQKKTKALWSAVTVTRILKNRIYIGVLEQGKREKVNYKLDKIVDKPKSKWSISMGNHEAIISKADFENVARLLSLDTRKAPNEEKLYLFSGLLFCGECGRGMVRRKGRGKGKPSVYYICSTHNKGKGCSRHSVKESLISEIVRDSIKRHVSQLAEKEELLREIDSMKVDAEDVIANDKEILAKHDEWKRCEEMGLALRKDLIEGVISEDEYTQFSKIYEERAACIEQAIVALQDEARKVLQKGLLFHSQLAGLVQNGDIERLDRNMVVSLIKKIIVHEDHRLEVVFKYDDECRAAGRIIETCRTLGQKVGHDG